MDIHGHKQENKKTRRWFGALLSRLAGKSNATLSGSDRELDELRSSLLPK